MIEFEPTIGSHIQHACEKAVAMANASNDSVSFSFNGVNMIAAPGETAKAVMDRWTEDFNRNAEAYRNSPEGKAMKAYQEDRQAYCQKETASLIDRLPNVVRDLPSLVRWLVSLSKSADHVGVAWKPDLVADTLEASGWKLNAHVGRPQEAFDDPTIMGEYLVGQSIDCLRKGRPPHPVIESFADRGGFLS